MDTVLGSVSVPAVGAGFLSFGPMRSRSVVEIVTAWTDRAEPAAAGVPITFEAAFFAGRADAEGYVNPLRQAQVIPIWFPHDGMLHEFRINRRLDNLLPFLGLRFLNFTAFNFVISACVQVRPPGQR